MKSILLHMGADPGMESRLQAAFDLARLTGGHLEIAQVRPVPAVYAGEAMGYVGSAGLAMQLVEEEERIAAAARAGLEPRLQAETIPYDIGHAMGPAAAVLLDRSLLADAVVMSLAGRGHRDLASALSEVVVKGDAPVLAVPMGWPRLDTDKPVLIAWKASSEAAAAVRAAVPLLKLASQVDVVTVDPEGEGAPGATGVARYLSRHGIACDLHQRRAENGSTAEILAAVAAELGSGLMVMGGYGRSRAMEFLLGGVTRRLLAESPLPLLMAH